MKSVEEMTGQEKEETRAWAKNWGEVGPILEEIRATDTVRAMEIVEGH